eukprot:6499768-Pyramimonas_sp.AAC.1
MGGTARCIMTSTAKSSPSPTSCSHPGEGPWQAPVARPRWSTEAHPKPTRRSSASAWFIPEPSTKPSP